MNKGYFLLILLFFFFPSSSMGNELQDEITELKNYIKIINERLSAQEKRIERLERLQEIKNSQNTLPPSKEGVSINTKNAKSILWHDPSNWHKAKVGMTKQQIRIILGDPTSVDHTGEFLKFIYEGRVPGSNYVKGIISFSDEGAFLIEPPEFLNQ